MRTKIWNFGVGEKEYIGNYGYEIVYRAGDTKSFSLKKKKSFFDINKSPWNNLTLNNEKNKEAYNLIMKLISARVEYWIYIIIWWIFNEFVYLVFH